MNKITWNGILPLWLNGRGRELLLDILKQLEAEGKVCLNPPSEEEIKSIILEHIVEAYNDLVIKHLTVAISKRLRGEI
jgi:hypothetical protein